ncbi:MAG: hypothetical protein V1804_02800 [Patescibacteria group bacterium]
MEKGPKMPPSPSGEFKEDEDISKFSQRREIPKADRQRMMELGMKVIKEQMDRIIKQMETVREKTNFSEMSADDFDKLFHTEQMIHAKIGIIAFKLEDGTLLSNADQD